MKKIVELTLRIVLEHDSDDYRFIAELPNKLANRLDDMTALVPEPIQVLSVDNPVPVINPKAIDFFGFAPSEKCIAISWNLRHVQRLRPDLTKDECWQVLLLAKATHRRAFGINDDVLLTIAEQFFGEQQAFDLLAT